MFWAGLVFCMCLLGVVVLVTGVFFFRTAGTTVAHSFVCSVICCLRVGVGDYYVDDDRWSNGRFGLLDFPRMEYTSIAPWLRQVSVGTLTPPAEAGRGRRVTDACCVCNA